MRNRWIAAAALGLFAVSAVGEPAIASEKKKVWVCKDTKKSNTKGTVVGAVAGGVLGNVVAGHGNKTAGTLIGAGVGGVAGHQIAKNKNAKKGQDCHYEYR